MEKTIVTILLVLAFIPPALGQDLCSDHPGSFECVSHPEKINLNRDFVTRTATESQRRISSLERSAEELGGGVASAMAMGAHQFDPSSDGLQGSIAVSGYEGGSGISFSIGAPVTESSFLNVTGAKGSHGVDAMSASFSWGF